VRGEVNESLSVAGAPSIRPPEARHAEHEYDDVPPNPTAMIESMRAYGYTLSTAIADLVDNSVAARCKHVWLDFHWSGRDSWIRIADDGIGMNQETLRNAMRLGSRNPTHHREPTDLGRFGLGLKTASLSQCRRLTVASRNDSCPVHVRRWDLDYLTAKEVDGWYLLKTPAPGSEARLEISENQSQGTVVLWEVLDRIVGEAAKDDSKVHHHFRKLIEAVETHLAMVFHRYLAREGRRRLRIRINNKEVRAWDPFLETHPATQATPEELIRLPGFAEPVRLKGFVLPHKDRLGEADHQHASGPEGWNAQQGFYLYRNDRLILPGSWLGLGGAKPWTKEEHYKLARIRLDVPNSMDHHWQLDVKKSSAQPPTLIKERLQGLALTVRKDAREVYAHRGRYQQRTGREKMRRAWKALHENGLNRYRIDREHPIVAAVLSGLTGEQRTQLEAALRIIEETVPVEQIWLDAAERPEAPARPLQGMTSKQISHLVRIAYQTIRRNRGLSHSGAVGMLLICEEFADDEVRAAIASLNPSD
jgi:hypothetical protein